MSIANAHVSLLYPLSLFYKADGLVLPRRAKIDGDDMPQPYRQLLVHDGDMTPTLETYFEGEMVLRPLHVEHDNGTYRRSVLLVRKADGFVAEFGAIQIDLDALPDEAAKRVVEASRPLGGILDEHGVEHHSHPSAYFRLVPDAAIRDVLQVTGLAPLYGRRNTITAADGATIAEVLEILPTFDEAGPKDASS